MSVVNSFDFVNPVFPADAPLPRVRKVLRYVVESAITGVGYGLIAFALGFGAYVGLYVASLVTGF